MIAHRLATIALALSPAPVLAAAPLDGMPSGIVLPAAADGLPRSAEPARADPLDYHAAYGAKGETVTIFVFRANYPNAALWFDRAQETLQEIWKNAGIGPGTDLTPITLAAAPATNGLARTFPIARGRKSTALAVAQVNNWIVKVRSTSATLSAEENAQRLQRIVAAVSTTRAIAKPHPLTLPEACPASDSGQSLMSLLDAKVVAKPSSATVRAGSRIAAALAMEVRGRQASLATNPQAYCRLPLGAGPALGAAYRSLDPATKGWTILLADSGRSVSGVPAELLEGDAPREGGMLATGDFDRINVLLFADAVPDMESAFLPAAQHLMSRSERALTTVMMEEAGNIVAIPN